MTLDSFSAFTVTVMAQSVLWKYTDLPKALKRDSIYNIDVLF